VGRAAGLLRGGDLVVGPPQVAGQEGRAVEHDVDLVGSPPHGVGYVGGAHVDGGHAGGEGPGHAGHGDPGSGHGVDGVPDHLRVDADGGNGRYARVGRVGPDRLLAQ
jgi:hypothetical protein